MFVIYSCGCKGIPLDEDNAVILIPCDEGVHDTRSAESLTWFKRGMTGAEGRKTYKPLTDDEQEQLHKQLSRRLAKADRFDDVRNALGVREQYQVLDFQASANGTKSVTIAHTCEVSSEDGYECDLPAGHEGPHQITLGRPEIRTWTVSRGKSKRTPYEG